jgi:hypothetical protein
MKPVEIIATRSLRKRRQNNAHGDRALISPLTSSTLSTVVSFPGTSSDAPTLMIWLSAFHAVRRVPPAPGGK